MCIRDRDSTMFNECLEKKYLLKKTFLPFFSPLFIFPHTYQLLRNCVFEGEQEDLTCIFFAHTATLLHKLHWQIHCSCPSWQQENEQYSNRQSKTAFKCYNIYLAGKSLSLDYVVCSKLMGTPAKQYQFGPLQLFRI